MLKMALKRSSAIGGLQKWDGWFITEVRRIAFAKRRMVFFAKW